MSIKLVAIDLDGTLFNSEGKLTQRVVNTLRKAMDRNVKVVITTGRAMSGVVEGVLETLGLYEEGNYVISSNGALAQKTDSGEKIFYRSLTAEDFAKFEEMSKKLGIHIQMIAEDTIYTPDKEIHKLTVREAYLTDTNLNYITSDDLPKDIDIIKMMLVGEAEILDSAIKKIPSYLFEEYTMVKSMPFFMEVLNKEASKGLAVKELGRYLNISQDEIMAIGDNDNDIDMIKYAGVGVAMGNAEENVRKIADFVTENNDTDGVAVAIEKYCFGE